MAADEIFYEIVRDKVQDELVNYEQLFVLLDSSINYNRHIMREEEEGRKKGQQHPMDIRAVTQALCLQRSLAAIEREAIRWYSESSRKFIQ